MSGRGRSDKGRGVVSQARKKQRRSDKRIAAALARCEEANPPTPPTSVFGRLGSQHESASSSSIQQRLGSVSGVRSRLGPSGSSYRPLSEFIAAEQQRRAFRESHQFAESATDWLTLSSTDHDSPSIFSRASTGVTAGSSVPPQSLVSQGETFVAASPLSSRRISIGATTSPLSLVSQGETFVAASPLSSRRVSIGATSSSPSLVSQGETTGPTIRVSTRRAFSGVTTSSSSLASQGGTADSSLPPTSRVSTGATEGPTGSVSIFDRLGSKDETSSSSSRRILSGATSPLSTSSSRRVSSGVTSSSSRRTYSGVTPLSSSRVSTGATEDSFGQSSERNRLVSIGETSSSHHRRTRDVRVPTPSPSRYRPSKEQRRH